MEGEDGAGEWPVLPTAAQRAARFRRRRWVVGLAAAAVVGAGVGGAVLLLSGDDDQGRHLLCPEDREAVEVIVFVRPDASVDEVAMVQAALEDRPEVSHLDHVTREEAQAEAEELFADDETMRDVLRPGDVPTSFRLEVPEPSDAERLAADIEPLPGVLSVEDSSMTVAALC